MNDARDNGFGMLWHQLDHIQTPRSRQITTPAHHHSIFTGRMLFRYLKIATCAQWKVIWQVIHTFALRRLSLGKFSIFIFLFISGTGIFIIIWLWKAISTVTNQHTRCASSFSCFVFNSSVKKQQVWTAGNVLPTTENFLIQFHTPIACSYIWAYMQKYKTWLNYLQIWQSYAILSAII